MVITQVGKLFSLVTGSSNKKIICNGILLSSIVTIYIFCEFVSSSFDFNLGSIETCVIVATFLA